MNHCLSQQLRKGQSLFVLLRFISNADIKAQQRIDIGSTTEVAQKTGAGLESPTGTTLALYRDPEAIINFQGARIQAITPVLGYEGSGYTPGYRPKVVISRPVAIPGRNFSRAIDRRFGKSWYWE